MSDINILSLKNAHQIRDYEEKKNHERRRNLLYLIAQYLKDECYFESAMCLSNEASLSSQFQVCDNIDLASVLQDFESYFHVRFQRYPKICKRVNAEEGPFITASRKLLKSTKKIAPEAVPQPAEAQKISKHPPTKSSSKTDVVMDNLHVTVTSVGTVQPPPVGDTADDGKARRKLKPLVGCKRDSEWYEMAELITKEIFLDDLDVHWEDIKGLEEPKRLLKEAVVYPIKYPALFQGVLSPWKGLLLFGPPGTGKTLLAKAVATETSTTFFNISASTIVSKWRGDSEKLVRVLFDLARYHAPSTIFLDEVEALASNRDSLEHEASRRLKTELLIQLDGLANSQEQYLSPYAELSEPYDRYCTALGLHPPKIDHFVCRELDPAMLRRLEKRILVDLPNSEARESMLRHYLPHTLNTQPPISCDIFYSFLAEEMIGYSGSDIRLVCKEAAMQAVRGVINVLEDQKNSEKKTVNIRSITTEDVQVALDKTRPSAAHFGDKFKTWQTQFGSF